MVVVEELMIFLHNGRSYQILKFDFEGNQLAGCWKSSEKFISLCFGLANGIDGKISRNFL
jgi:hypothetical protein